MGWQQCHFMEFALSISTVALPHSSDQAAMPKAIAAEKVSRFYRPELDALRFFAFLFVFIGHGLEVNIRTGVLHRFPLLARGLSFLTHAGGFGLSLFFFLSSFLITTLLMLERDRAGTIALRSFYMRRILRIWPLYFTFMAVAFIIGQLWEPARFNPHALLAYYAISANWYVIAAGSLPACVMFLWSISVEEQFYLIWPTCVRRLSPNGIRNFCIGLMAAGFIGIAILAYRHTSILNIWFNSITESIFFASGGLLALRLGLRSQQKSWARSLIGIAVCIISWLAADDFANLHDLKNTLTPVHALLAYALITVGVNALLWAFLHLPRQLLFRPLVYLGRISYGLYVFHGMALLLARHLLAHRLPGGIWLIPTFAFTVLLAVLSYEFFEKPFLKLKHRFEIVHSRTA
jgi:peptidoglycan/LPS O-acetylase OafA/YrhL